jgi:hypothetical protein
MPSDYFIQTLTCAICGTSHPDVAVGTRIQDEPRADDLRVGDRVEVVREGLTSSAPYLPVSPFSPRGDFSVLESWECTTCRKVRWALICVSEDDVLESIEAVKLSPALLDRANLISYDLIDVFEAYTGVPLFEENSFLRPYRADFVELLRKHVSETPE